jgi:hypothetical protein
MAAHERTAARMIFPHGAIIYNITNLPKASASTARQVAIAVAIGDKPTWRGGVESVENDPTET